MTRLRVLSKKYSQILFCGESQILKKIKFLLQFSASPYISSIARKKIEEDEEYFIGFLKKAIKEKLVKNLPIDYIMKQLLYSDCIYCKLSDFE